MFRFALQNLLSRPIRSLLALMGLVVAIMGMVGLFSIAVGIDDTFNRTFQRIPGLAAMQPGAPIPLFSRLPSTWAAEIGRVNGVRVVRPEVWARAQLVEGEPTFSPPRLLFGIDIPQTLALKKAVYRDDLVQGRFLNAEDPGTTNCIVSQQIAEDFHKHLGDTLRVDGVDLKIVGIYRCGSLLLDVAIVLDVAAVRRISRIEERFVTSIYFEPSGSVPNDQLIKTIRELFRGRDVSSWQQSGLAAIASGESDMLMTAARMLQVGPPKGKTDPKAAKNEDTIEIRSATDWGEKIHELSSDLDIFLCLMTGIGVVIALLSILNTMLMSVAERMIEFGVLKANGWSAWDVMRLITWESALLGIAGGLLGCGLGWIAVQIVNWCFPTRIHLYASPGLLLFSLIFSTAIGIVGGLYPAYWAVRMSPMEAIRRG